jgi:hypothetical protein
MDDKLLLFEQARSVFTWYRDSLYIVDSGKLLRTL